jgi:hypothetical protein
MTVIATNRPSAKKARTYVLYGLDEQNRPRGAQFITSDPALIAKAASVSDLEICEAKRKTLKDVAKTLPLGRLCANGRASLPYLDPALYRTWFYALVSQPKADQETKVVPSGLPQTWHDIAPGHLVIAQETAEIGWWEAVVVEREADVLKLRYRDYPYLPKFTRPTTAVALLNTATPQARQPASKS